MSNRSVLTQMLVARLQDEDTVLTAIELDDALGQALSEYSRRLPLSRMYVIEGDGTTTRFPVPATWQRDWSAVLSVEYPAGQAEPVYLPAASWSLYQDADDTLHFRFVTAPAAGSTVNVRYTALHTATGAATTVPSRHWAAVANLGASNAAHMLAMHYTPMGDTSFQTDVSDHAGRSDRYAQRSKELKERFDMEVPDPTGQTGTNGAASGTSGYRRYLRVVRT